MPMVQKKGSCRDLAILPAAGAFDTTPIIVDLNAGFFGEITFDGVYTRGAAGGKTSFIIEGSFDKVRWINLSESESQGVTSNANDSVLIQNVVFTYGAVTASAEGFNTALIRSAYRYYRVFAKESGMVGSPGTLSMNYIAICTYG